MFGIRIENGALVWDEALPTPAPQPHEVLIKVDYAGVNRADLFQMQGSYPAPDGASPLPGLEASGTIAAMGNKVRNFTIGQKVCALLEGGGYGEYATAAASQVFTLPHGWGLREAAGLPETLFTVWFALFHTAQVQAGETVLVHAGASGIGSMATQMLKAAGAIALTTASTAEKCAFSQQQGAAACYPYKEGDFVDPILNEYSGVDAVLDVVGGDYFQKNLKLLKKGGRMVSLAFLRGAKAELNLAPLLLKNISWYGLTLRSQSTTRKAQLAKEIRKHCWQWLENGQIILPIHHEFPLAEAKEALKMLEQNLNLGKIILKA